MTTTESMAMVVTGRVQGVGFRYYTQRKAKELGIKGYVQNRPDGSVYIEGEGDPSILSDFVLWCQKGPPWAKVTQVKLSPLPPVGHKEFSIR
jgi:acylphosphatase